MKKFLFIFALAAVVSVSCQKQCAVSSFDSKGEIVFGTKGVKVTTKAFAETTNDTLQHQGFKVAAVVDGATPSVMFNSAVKYNTTDQVYRVHNGTAEEHYYYPNEGTMSFYGVYPSTQAITVSDAGVATAAYTQNADTDLVAAKATAVGKSSQPVLMQFGHILSQVSMTVKTDNANVDCKLFSLTVNDANGGTYSFKDEKWTLNTTKNDYPYLTSGTGENVTTTEKAVGSAMSFMPGDVTVTAQWNCYNKTGGQLLSNNTETVNVTLAKGVNTTLKLTLPANSSEITFVTSVGPWATEDENIVMKTPYVPELVNGVFTVNDSGKTVKFTKGNLYWNGSEFRCEANQYDYPTTREASHIGHFFYSKTASVAYAASYKDDDKTTSDVFFAIDGGAIEGFTALSKAEWDYLFTNALEKASDNPKVVTIADKKCVVLRPDGFSGEVAGSYTAEAWATAEASGLVALPFAGYYFGSSLSDAGSHGNYWSCTPRSGRADGAYYAGFYSDDASTNYFDRGNGYSVRLVSDQ